MYEDIIAIIANNGFPIGVAVFLLVRFEKKLEGLTKSISDLGVVIQILLDRKE